MDKNHQEIRKAAIESFRAYLTRSREGTEVLRVLIEDLSVPSTLVAKKLGVNKVKMSRAFNGKTSLEFDQRRLLLEVLSTTLDALEKGLVAAEKGSTSRVLSERLPIAQSKLETGRKVVEREEANLAEC